MENHTQIRHNPASSIQSGNPWPILVFLETSSWARLRPSLCLKLDLWRSEPVVEISQSFSRESNGLKTNLHAGLSQPMQCLFTKDAEIIRPEASELWSIYSSTCLGSKERKKSQNCEVNQSKSILDGRFVLILSLPCPISSPTASTRGGGGRSLGERRKVMRTVLVSDVFSLRSHGHQNRKASETKQRQST